MPHNLYLFLPSPQSYSYAHFLNNQKVIIITYYMTQEQSLLEGEFSLQESWDEFSCNDELKKRLKQTFQTISCCRRRRKQRHEKQTAEKTKIVMMGIVLLALITAFVVLFLYYKQQHGINQEVQLKKKGLKEKLEGMMDEREISKIQKRLNLHGMGINSLYISQNPGENFNADASIRILNLSGNNIDSFSGAAISTLETIDLNNNPLLEFSSTNFPNLKQIHLQNTVLNKFNNNVLDRLQSLDFINLGSLEEFSQNKLQSLGRLMLPSTLQHFDGNFIPVASNFSIVGYPYLKSMSDNHIRVDNLHLKSPNLTYFDNNHFEGLEELFLKQSKIQALELASNPDLEEIYIGASNPIRSITMKSNPRLSSIIYDGKGLVNFTAFDCSIKQFPLDHFFPPKLKLLYLQNNFIGSCDLSAMKQLQSVYISDYSLHDITLSSQNSLSSFTLANTLIEDLSNLTFPTMSSFNLVNNSHLKKFSNNNFSPLQQFSIRNSPLITYSNNKFPAIKKLQLYGNKKVQQFLKDVNKSTIQDLTLVSNQLESYNFDSFVNLVSLNIIKNPIVELQFKDLPYLTILKLNLTKLITLNILNTSVTDLSKIYLHPVELLYIQNTPIQSLQNLFSSDLMELKFNNTQLKSFKDNNFPSLEILSIRNSPLEVLQMNQTNSLRRLNLQNTSLKEIDSQLKLKNLKKLFVLNNPLLQSINYPLVSNLKLLQLSNNPSMKKLHLKQTQISNLSNLDLNITSFQLVSNKQFLEFNNNSFKRLRHMRLQNINVDKLDVQGSFREEMSQLKTVILTNIQLFSIPYLGKSVQTINISNISLQKLVIPSQYQKPITLFLQNQNLNSIQFQNTFNLLQLSINLPSLQHICIINSSIKNINYGINSLQTLWLQNTLIEQIQEVSFPHLLQLSIIGEGPRSISMNYMPNLQTLELNAKIITLELHTLRYLKTFILKNTELLSFPRSCRFPSLQTLIVEQNQILGEMQISNIQNLSTLQLSGVFNSIQIINTKISTLQNLNINSLRNLTLQNNSKLIMFNNNNFPNLQTLILQNNNIYYYADTFFQSLKNLTIIQNSFIGMYQMFNPSKIKRLVLANTQPSTFVQNGIFPNLKSLQIFHILDTNFIEILDFPKLKHVKIKNQDQNDQVLIKIANIPLTQGLDISGNNFGLLEIVNSQLNKLDLDIVNVASLKLSNTSIKEIKYISNSLKSFTLDEQNLNKLEIQSRSLESVDIKLPSGVNVYLNAPLKKFKHVLPEVKTLHLKNTFLEELRIVNSTELTEMVIQSKSKELFSLELANNQLKALDGSSIVSLKELSLSNMTGLKTIPTYQKIDKLEVLQISNCDSVDFRLGQNYQYLKSLVLNGTIFKIVNISNHNLESVRLNLTQLTNLSLSSPKLSLKMSQILTPNITKLQLIGVQIHEWTQYQPKTLKDLTVINTSISQITLNQSSQLLQNVIITNNRKLWNLSLNLAPKANTLISGNNISKLNLVNYNQDELFINQPNIQELELKDCGIKDLYIKELYSIKSITVENCKSMTSVVVSSRSSASVLKLTDLPALTIISISRMPELQILQLSNLPLFSLTYFNFPLLRNLSLEKTTITQVQKLKIPKIRNVTINNNKIQRISDWNHPQLQIIQISSSNMEVFGKNCTFKSLKQLNFYNVGVSEIFLENMEGLTNLYLQNVNLLSFSNYTFPNLKSLILSSKNLISLVGNYFPSLTLLRIANLANIPQLDILSCCSALQNLTLSNIQTPISLNTKSYSNLLSLQLLKTPVQSIIVHAPLQRLVINQQTITSSFQIDLQFDPSCQLVQLTLQDTNLKNFSHKSLPSLKRLNLQDNRNLVKYQNNTFPNLQSLLITTSKLQEFRDNQYPQLKFLFLQSNNLSIFQDNHLPKVDYFTIQYNQITIFNQSLPSANNVNFRNNNLTNLNQNFFQLLPKVQKLELRNNNITHLSGFQSLTISKLNLDSTINLQQMKDNYFPELDTLDVSNQNLSRFSNNNFPKLNNLRIDNNPKLGEYLLLSALSDFKGQGASMTTINLKGIQFQQSTKDAIRSINPNATVLFDI